MNNNGTITKFIYDSDRVIAEYDNSGSLICEYVYGNSIDEVLFMIKGNDFYYCHYDSLGSVRAITDGSEAIVETYIYDVYGKPTIYDASHTEIPQSQFGNRFYFTGREFDKESGLYYYGARYYDPELGRFMSPDPMHIVNGPNLYTYCENSPLNKIDPLGYLWEKPYSSIPSELNKLAKEANEMFGSDDKAKHKHVSKELSDTYDPATALAIGIAKELKDLLDNDPKTHAEWEDLKADIEGIAEDIWEDIGDIRDKIRDYFKGK